MGTSLSLPWLALLLLGAGHGVNPAMGWLFAVARGLQERSGAAVWRTLAPLAIGHALAIAVAVSIGVLVGLAIPLASLRWVVAATLLGFGVYRLFNHRHPSGGGMRVGRRELTIWSFLMASAHGAGLMVLPFVLREPAGSSGAHARAPHAELADRSADAVHAEHLDVILATLAGDQFLGLVAAAVHTAAYLIVTGAIALLVYRKLGVRLLRTAWINLDLIWAVALIATGILTPLL